MRRIIKISVICVLIAILAVGLLYAYGGNDVKSISYETKSSAQSIRVDWSPVWGVRHYDIYRADVTGGIYTTDYIAFDEYEKVGSVSGLHTSFEDKKVENGHYYSYVVRGFSKDKVICDSYSENMTQYECAGLATPELGNNGYGENNENSPECIYLYAQIDGGMPAEGVLLYRRAYGKGEFEMVDAEPSEESDGVGTYSFDLKDSSVEPGEIYEYKVRTFAGDGENQVLSDYSEAVRIPAVNFIGQYKISEMKTAPETGKLQLTISSDPYNGELALDKGAIASFSVKDDKGKNRKYNLSLDGGIKLAAGEEKTLAFTCEGKKLPEMDKPAGLLVIEDEGVTYDMGVFGYSELELDLDKKTGTVFVDWDN